MPNKAGWLYHKEGCKCRPCTGKAKALALGPGEPGDPTPSSKDVINADLPVRKVKGKEILYRQDRTMRGRVREWHHLRTLDPTLTTKEIAEKLGVGHRTLLNYIQNATKEGWLAFSDPLERIEHEIIPLVTDNLTHFLRAKDKQVTIEAAKGALWPAYQASKGMNEAPTTVLALKIEAIDPAQVRAITGHIVGKPRTIEAEVVPVLSLPEPPEG